MFGSTTLDIVIGLVLIYLLYSLLVTILAEMISNWLGIRPRILRISIELMLNDNNYYGNIKRKHKLRYWIYRMTLYEFSAFRESLAGKFYDQPSIKYLATGAKKFLFSVKNSKPAYFSSANFADTLIHLLRSRGEGDNDIAKITFCLKYNTLHIQPDTLKHLRNLLSDAGGEINTVTENLEKWFSDTQDRATGWYKRKMTLILFILGFFVAVAFNVNSIFLARLLSKDKSAREQFVNLGIQLSKDSTRYRNFIVSDHDTIYESKVLDTAFSNIRKDISDANMILGLGWHWSNLKKPCYKEISEKSHPLKYAALIKWKAEMEAKKDSLYHMNKTIDQLSKEKHLSSVSIERLKKDSLSLMLDSAYLQLNKLRSASLEDTLGSPNPDFKKLSDSLSITRGKIQNEMRRIAVLNKSTLILSNSITAYRDSLKNLTQIISDSACIHFISVDSMRVLEKRTIRIYGKVSYNAFDKVCYIIHQTVTNELFILGFILTALAISLGAPFWFDLLKRLVSIRGAGVKPEEKETTSPVTGGDLLNKKTISVFPGNNMLQADPIDAALDALTVRLKDESDVVAIAIENISVQNSQGIVVYVNGDGIKKFLSEKYGSTITVSGKVIPVRYDLQQPIIAHIGSCGGSIANKKQTLGHGTLGCYLNKKDVTAKFMLSCWHVMKDNAHWDQSPVEKEMIDGDGNVIGTIKDGCLTDLLDIGIAECNDQHEFSNQPLPIRSQHRRVVPYDAFINSGVTFCGRVSHHKKAKIFHHKVNAILMYPGEMSKRIIYDTFSIAIINNETGALTSPTSAGDSGAVIVDENFTPLGMIIGGNDKVSYAIKFSNAFDQNKIYSQYSFLI